MKSTEATDTPQPPPSVRPKRPTLNHSGDGRETARYHDAMDVYRAEVEAFDKAKAARALAAGRAVYDLLLAEAPKRRPAGSEPVFTVKGEVNITPEGFRDFRVWCRAHGVHCPECPPSMEFEWFGGSVLVVVR